MYLSVSYYQVISGRLQKCFLNFYVEDAGTTVLLFVLTKTDSIEFGWSIKAETSGGFSA